MTFTLNDEERKILLRTLKARLDDLHTEMTQTDSPEFNIQLKHEEEIIQALIERLDSAPPQAAGGDHAPQRVKPHREVATVSGPLWLDREGTMATEFTVILEDKPGTLARLGIVLRGGVPIDVEKGSGVSSRWGWRQP